MVVTSAMGILEFSAESCVRPRIHAVRWSHTTAVATATQHITAGRPPYR